jgi:hypothetical protein
VPGEGLCQKLVVYMEESLLEWGEERSRRPPSTPTQTPDARAAAIVRRRQTLSSGGLGPVSADGMREHLRQHGGDALPSRRTISRMLKRQAKEVTAHSFPSSV